jgi:hypothetical protein
MRESVSTHHDGYKTGDFRNGSGEQSLNGRETAIERRSLGVCKGGKNKEQSHDVENAHGLLSLGCI